MSGILGWGSIRNFAILSALKSGLFGDRGEGRDAVGAVRLVRRDDMTGGAPALGERLAVRGVGGQGGGWKGGKDEPSASAAAKAFRPKPGRRRAERIYGRAASSRRKMIAV